MRVLDSGPVRGGVFFAAAFLIATTVGIAIGDLRQGIATGVAAGFVMAVFGWGFVRPAEDEP